MKRPDQWLAVFTVASALGCLYAFFGLAFYFAWSKIDPGMEKMWTWKREFYSWLLIISSVVGLPLWLRFVVLCIQNRKKR